MRILIYTILEIIQVNLLNFSKKNKHLNLFLLCSFKKINHDT